MMTDTRAFRLSGVLCLAVSITASYCRGADVDPDSSSWQIEYELNQRVFRSRPSSKGRTFVRDLPKIMRGPYWTSRISPDENRWICVTTEDGEAEIWTCGRRGEDPKKLTDNNSIDNMPEWSPDGTRIIFGSTRTGRWQIWIMDSDGENQVQVTDHQKGVKEPLFSPSGKRFAYLQTNKRQGITPHYRLLAANIDGSDVQTVVNNDSVHGFTWGRTDDTVIYSNIGGLYIVSADGDTLVSAWEFQKISQNLDHHAAFTITPRPDGRVLACTIGYCGQKTGGVGPDDPWYTKIHFIPVFGKEQDAWSLDAGGEAHPIRWLRK